MVENIGEATVYAGGTTSRPLPVPDLTRRSSVPRCGDCDRAISAQDARVDGLCRRCRNPQAGAPKPPAKDQVYPEYSEVELDRRFTGPTEAPPTSTPAPAAATATPPAQAGPATTAAVEANAGVEPAPIRAKITAAQPGPGVLIAITGVTPTQVAPLLTDLLTALHKGTQTAAPATPVGKPAAGAAPRRTRTSTAHNEAHAEDIIRRYTAGESSAAIGRDLGASGQAIRSLLRRHQIPIRDKGTPPAAAIGARLRELGTTARGVKTWAHTQGLITDPTKAGPPPSYVIDAYQQQHPTSTGEATA